jgi:predicted alpha/beta hydrolase family esterase
MKKQVIVIHGANSFDSYDEYINYLKNREVTVESFLSWRGWKDNLADELGSDFEVFAPRMPNKDNAKYAEWKIWFERIFPYIQEDVVLVGHSMGGIFLVKYLSKIIFPKK